MKAALQANMCLKPGMDPSAQRGMTMLPLRIIFGGVKGCIVPPPHPPSTPPSHPPSTHTARFHIEVLTPSTSECNCIWR